MNFYNFIRLVIGNELLEHRTCNNVDCTWSDHLKTSNHNSCIAVSNMYNSCFPNARKKGVLILASKVTIPLCSLNFECGCCICSQRSGFSASQIQYDHLRNPITVQQWGKRLFTLFSDKVVCHVPKRRHKTWVPVKGHRDILRLRYCE